MDGRLRRQLASDKVLRPARHGAALALVLYVVLLGFGSLPLAVDAHAYWMADALAPYGQSSLGSFDAFFYSPAFAQALWPLTRLPWPLFAAAWSAILGVALYLVTGRWFGLVVPLVGIELAMGNIHILLGLAVAASFRWPAAWVFVILTKVTPAVGLVWYLVRREWRALGIAVGATAAVAAISYVIAPAAWPDWIRLLLSVPEGHTTIPVPLWLRLPAAVVIVAWGARTDRRWTVVVAAWMALPAWWWNGTAVLVGVIPLLDGWTARVGAPPLGRSLSRQQPPDARDERGMAAE
jgi:hypothetical protein